MKVKDLIDRRIKLESELEAVLSDYLFTTAGAVEVGGVTFYHSYAAEASKLDGILMWLESTVSESIPDSNTLEVDDLVRLSTQANDQMVKLVYNFQRETKARVEEIKLTTYPVHRFKVILEFPRHLTSSRAKEGSFLMNLLNSINL